MAVMLKYKNTRAFTTVKYNQWVNDIVKKGDAYKYEVFKTWDLVIVRKKKNGVFRNLEITEIENAKNLKQQFPLEYDYVGFNEKIQIAKDIKRSEKIRRWRFFFTVIDAINRIIRQIKKPFQNIILLTWLMIILSILSIAVMILFGIINL